MIRPDTAVRFIEKIAFTDHCWLWLGATAGRGYGVFGVPGRDMDYAHRVSYELFVGPIPDGLEIHHECQQLLCVKPTHLKACTHLENVRATPLQRCRNGHPYDAVNTGWSSKGYRFCRVGSGRAHMRARARRAS